jgi:hypothetical protein
MKPIDYFENHVKEGYCPWSAKELTQTALESVYICRRDYGAGARGEKQCTIEDWKKCPLIANQMLPSFRAAVKEGEKIVA